MLGGAGFHLLSVQVQEIHGLSNHLEKSRHIPRIFNGSVLCSAVREPLKFHCVFEANLIAALFPSAVMVLQARMVSQPRQLHFMEPTVIQQLSLVKLSPAHQYRPYFVWIDPIFESLDGFVEQWSTFNIILRDARSLRAKFRDFEGN